MRWLRLTVRHVSCSPGFAITAFLTLAVGFGAATTIFSIVYAALLRPLPYPRPDRLVAISHTLQVRGSLEVEQTDASILLYRRHNRAFAEFGGYQAGAVAISSPRADGAERVAAARVTAGVLDALRVSPVRGRVFTSPDDQPGAPPVVIVAERLWARRFGGDPDLLHRRIIVDGQPREVVGILSDVVRFPETDTEVWLPLVLDPARTDSASFDYKALARLRDGASIEQAETDLQGLLLRLPVEFPGRLTRAAIDQTHMRVAVRPLASIVVGGVARLLWVMFGASAFVLLAACVNVACLFLVRGEARRRTFAIQRLLGAPAGVVLLEFLSEIGLVTCMGALSGLAIAAGAARAIRSLAPVIDIPRLTEVRIDSIILVAIGMAIVGVAATIAAFTAWRLRTSTSDALSSLGPGSTVSRTQHRTRYALVALQVALATVLVTGSGLMARSVWALRRVEPGFNKASALTFRLAFPPSVYSNANDVVRFVGRLLDDAGQIPGAHEVAAASRLPLEEQPQTETAVFAEDKMLAPGELPRLHPVAYVTPGYFRAMGIPLVAGDSFSPLEPRRMQLEAVVSRAFAKSYWAGESAIGKHIRILVNGPLYRIVGVAADVRDAGLDRPVDEIVYCPLLPPPGDARWQPRDLSFVMRTSDDPGATLASIRAAIHRLDPSLPIYHAAALSDLVAGSSARRRLVLLLLTASSIIAVVLGAIGLYGVMAYVVSLRTREIGIRMALGEQPLHLGLTVAGQGLSVAALGVICGIVGATALARALGTLLFAVTPSDPLVLALSSVFVLALASAASFVPSRRAASVDPAFALRAE
jgi:putative ABC transport system permease protein